MRWFAYIAFGLVLILGGLNFSAQLSGHAEETSLCTPALSPQDASATEDLSVAAKVHRIWNGDTVHFELLEPLAGCLPGEIVSLVVGGADTPETSFRSKACGERLWKQELAAANRSRDYLEHLMPAGSQVALVNPRATRTGRYRSASLVAGDRNIGSAMIEAGCAASIFDDPATEGVKAWCQNLEAWCTDADGAPLIK
ncbi:MAG: hypothetical protein AAGB03_01860 [Pseudomonadota bacterium]